MTGLRRHFLLPLTIVGFLAALGLALLMMFREVETTQQALRTGNWHAVQIEIEFQRFLKSLARYGLNDSEVSYADLNRRLDILWSRLLLTDGGPATADLRDDVQFVEVTAQLRRALERVDPFIKELSRGDEGGYRAIAAEMAPFEPMLHQLVQYLVMRSDKLARSAALEARYWEIIGAYAGVVLTGGALVVMLLRERRRAERLARAAAATRIPASGAPEANPSERMAA
jgi:hypothetical protein